MDNTRNPYIRVPIAIAVIVMLFFTSTREFLKLTFMLGVPFIFIMGFMGKKHRYSIVWFLCGLLLLGLLGAYGYNLVHLPGRIQVREITTSGADLVAQGKYDEAIAQYERLGALGKPERMQEKIAEAQTEKDAHLQLEKARQLIQSGNKDEALQIINALPASTRAAQEAKELKKDLQ